MTRLKELRLRKQLTIADLCRMSGLSPYWYCMAENGVRISIQAKEKIAKALGEPIENLFTEDTPSPNSCKN